MRFQQITHTVFKVIKLFVGQEVRASIQSSQEIVHAWYLFFLRASRLRFAEVFLVEDLHAQLIERFIHTKLWQWRLEKGCLENGRLASGRLSPRPNGVLETNFFARKVLIMCISLASFR